LAVLSLKTSLKSNSSCTCLGYMDKANYAIYSGLLSSRSLFKCTWKCVDWP